MHTASPLAAANIDDSVPIPRTSPVTRTPPVTRSSGLRGCGRLSQIAAVGVDVFARCRPPRPRDDLRLEGLVLLGRDRLVFQQIREPLDQLDVAGDRTAHSVVAAEILLLGFTNLRYERLDPAATRPILKEIETRIPVAEEDPVLTRRREAQQHGDAERREDRGPPHSSHPEARGTADQDVRSLRLIWALSIVVLVLTLVLVAVLSGERVMAFGSLFVSDAFAVFCKILVLLGSVMTMIISRGFLERQGMARFEYPILVVFATLGMMMMVSANDLISLYLGLEMQSLSLYVIAAFQRDDERSTEAGLKYFVLGALASGLLLYGSSLIYGFSGTTNFDQLAALFGYASQAGPGTGVIFGIVFIMAGLAFKVSAVPFHMWTPDVYEGAPTPVTAFFSVAPKIAALALFMRVMIGPFGDLLQHWQQIVAFVSIASMILGALTAINQRNIKRLMAYSSIGHVGYALIGLAVGDAAGIRGVLNYLAIYLVMNVGTFACILCMRRDDRMVEGIDDLAGLSKSHPMLAAALAVFMFSMAGIPPLAGFFGKLYVFLAAIEAELYTLAVIGVLTSVIAAFYYIRIIRVMYFDDIKESLDKPVERELHLVLAATGLLVLLFFLYPSPVLSSAAAAAAALFAG